MTQHSLKTLSNTTATLLTPNGTYSSLDITIQNTHPSAMVYVGGIGVTTLDYGYRIMPNTAVSFSLVGRDALYAITDTNTSKIAVIELGLN